MQLHSNRYSNMTPKAIAPTVPVFSGTSKEGRKLFGTSANGRSANQGSIVEGTRRDSAPQLSVAGALNRQRRGRRHLARHRELKGRTPPGVAASPQAAAMRLNNPATDGQSYAGSLRFRGEERLENAFGFLSRKPNPRVTHRN